VAGSRNMYEGLIPTSAICLLIRMGSSAVDGGSIHNVEVMEIRISPSPLRVLNYLQSDVKNAAFFPRPAPTTKLLFDHIPSRTAYTFNYKFYI
jgi:hypothetical protein